MQKSKINIHFIYETDTRPYLEPLCSIFWRKILSASFCQLKRFHICCHNFTEAGCLQVLGEGPNYALVSEYWSSYSENKKKLPKKSNT